MINGLELLPLLTKLYRSAQKVIENCPLFPQFYYCQGNWRKKVVCDFLHWSDYTIGLSQLIDYWLFWPTASNHKLAHTTVDNTTTSTIKWYQQETRLLAPQLTINNTTTTTITWHQQETRLLSSQLIVYGIKKYCCVPVRLYESTFLFKLACHKCMNLSTPSMMYRSKSKYKYGRTYICTSVDVCFDKAAFRL